MAWEENSCICLHMQLIAILSRIGVKFITFAVTKTTFWQKTKSCLTLWFAQNSLPLRWQRQLTKKFVGLMGSCDLLKIHYLCGDKDNLRLISLSSSSVVICSKFITFAVTKTTTPRSENMRRQLWFAQNSLPLRWQRQQTAKYDHKSKRCDLLKIHYLCGDKDNRHQNQARHLVVVICSKFITFAVTKTTVKLLHAVAR